MYVAVYTYTDICIHLHYIIYIIIISYYIILYYIILHYISLYYIILYYIIYIYICTGVSMHIMYSKNHAFLLWGS